MPVFGLILARIFPHLDYNNSEYGQFSYSVMIYLFPNVINEWNKFDKQITDIASRNTFKNSWLSFFWPLHCDTFGIHNPVRLQLLTKLQMGLSHLNKHKFKHNFRDFLNPPFACNLKPEKTSHYLLRCHLFQKRIENSP